MYVYTHIYIHIYRIEFLPRYLSPSLPLSLPLSVPLSLPLSPTLSLSPSLPLPHHTHTLSLYFSKKVPNEDEASDYKLVLCVRHDLKMKKGKVCFVQHMRVARCMLWGNTRHA